MDKSDADLAEDLFGNLSDSNSEVASHVSSRKSSDSEAFVTKRKTTVIDSDNEDPFAVSKATPLSDSDTSVVKERRNIRQRSSSRSSVSRSMSVESEKKSEEEPVASEYVFLLNGTLMGDKG
jgi:hypothetical protein